MADEHRPKMDAVGAFVVVIVTMLEVFITVAPYLGYNVGATGSALSAQQLTLVSNVFMVIVGYLFGSSVSGRRGSDGVQKPPPDAPAVAPAATSDVQ